MWPSREWAAAEMESVRTGGLAEPDHSAGKVLISGRQPGFGHNRSVGQRWAGQ